MKKASLALAAFVMAGAQAATITFEYGLPPVLASTEITQTGSLGLFDSSLGTLTGAELRLRGRFQWTASGTNNARAPQSVALSSQITLSWDSSLDVLDPFLADDIGSSFSTSTQPYDPGETKIFGPFNSGGFDVEDLAAVLAALQADGGGSFDLTCKSNTVALQVGGQSDFIANQDMSAACDARITYTFDAAAPVPEPASLALVGLALGVAGVASRRRRV